MIGRGDGLALAVVLLYGLLADGLMETLGPLRFSGVFLAVLAGAVVLHSLPEAKRKGPVSKRFGRQVGYKAR